MRKFLLALALALCAPAPVIAQGPIVGPGNLIICTKTAQASPAAAGTLSLVNGVANQSIFICGWHVTSNQTTSSTFQLVYGTQGGPCSTPTNMTPAFAVTSNAPSADHIDYVTIQAALGAQVCVTSAGSTVGQAVLIYYNQF